MTGQQLRNSILQEAIHGRLVPNVLQPGEKTGEELLKAILAERQKKENEEKGKKAKTLTLSTIEEEPWELPDGWCWCRLGDVMTFVNGRAYKKEELLSSGKYKVLRVGNFFTNDSWYYSDLELPDEKYCFKGDLLYAWSASFGPWIWEGDRTIFHYHIWNVKFNEDNLYKRYLYWFFEADKHIIKESTTGSTMVHVSMENMTPRLIPLPPLSIQKAIVAKIEELLPLVDEYDKAAVELETLNKILPDKLRKSVLQEAIHGTLVPNDIPESEATGAELLQQILKERQDRENKEKGKKAKKLTLSTIEEEPWELPEGWCWCKLKDIIDFTSSGTTKNGAITSDSWILDLEDIEKETGRLICKKRFGDVKSKSDKRAFKTGNVLYSKLRPYLNKCIIADEDGYCTTEILAFDFGPIYNRYAQSFLMSPYFVDRVNQGAAGVKMPRVNNAEANDTCFPIPPLSIQHRIVEKIEEVFSAIDKLQA